MGNSKKRKKKKKVGYNSLGMIAIALVVLVLLGGLMLESNDLKERLTGYDAKAATLQQQIEDEQTRKEIYGDIRICRRGCQRETGTCEGQ